MIEIKNKENCCGCHACYSICPVNAIKMKRDEKGFEYPVVDKEKCINCDLCKKVCPIINNMQNDKKKEDIKAYACMNKDLKTRMNSSSGGIFTLIAEYILKLNGVVFGASFNENFEIVHSYIEKVEDIHKFQGSKYVQSKIGEMYKKAKEFLENDRYVLFTGTPCQIEGLYQYLQKDYDKLYTQDLICHGVPSPKVWNKYLEEKSKEYKGKPEEISFREKENRGWGDYEIKIQFEDTSYISNHNKDIYMQAFIKDISLRDSCYNCKFKKKLRNSDITLADFWGVGNIDQDLNDNKGTSLVILNSKDGQNLFEKIKEKIICKQVNFEEAIRYNPSMINSAKKTEKREEFFKDLDNSDLENLVKKYTKTPILKKSLNKAKRLAKKILKVINIQK